MRPDLGPSSLYKLYNSEGTLLYIGVTGDVDKRVREHSRSRTWWTPGIRVEHKAFADRASALQAEYEAIRDEKPLHNVAIDQRGRVGGTRVNFDFQRDEHQGWKLAATYKGQTLKEWVRRALNEVAERQAAEREGR